jgi:hypothetical protein
MQATKAYTISGIDGNHLTLSETPDRLTILVSIQQNDERGRLAVHLDKGQFEELTSLNGYLGLEVREPEAEEAQNA